MAAINPITHIQLGRFVFREQSLCMGDSVYMTDDFALPTDLPLPIKLTFTVAIICVEGEFSATINQKLLSASRGDVLIGQAGCIVESLHCSANLKTISMAFANTDEGRLFNRPAEELDIWLVHRSIPVSIHLSEAQLQMQMDLYAQIKKLYWEAAPPMRGEIVKGFISISVASFLSIPQVAIGKSSIPQPGSRKEEVFLHFMDDLQLYANRERSVKFYSDRQGISQKHFSKLVHQASGKLPMEHIQQRVIVEAKTLLRSSNKSIKEIAEALCFPTDSFFCRYFKHETGVSPTDFRQHS